MLKQVSDSRHQSYVVYGNHVLLMTRILSSIFYISSMRKTSEEFNSETAIKNIGILCGEELSELPYWETINDYLKRFSDNELQKVICELVRHLLRSRAFEDARIRGKYWQIILDGTQLQRSRKELDKRSLYSVHKKGTEEEYREYYYYVLEAKLVLHEKIQVSIMTEFVENEGREAEKQDCERNAAKRLMEKLKKEYPMLPVCICGDSLYACESFFEDCEKKRWKYILRYKQGSIPSIYEEYREVKGMEKNGINTENGRYDYVTDIEYRKEKVNVAEYVEYGEKEKKTEYLFLTNLTLSRQNIKNVIERGRWRWKIENEGFNIQKNHGYYLEHMYSRDYQGIKNHYYLIQIGHMIAQIMEAIEKLWKKVKQSKEQKHQRILESWKTELLSEYMEEMEKPYQIRFI